MKALSFSDLPFNWAVCYQTDCPPGSPLPAPARRQCPTPEPADVACGQPQAALVRRLSALRGLDTAGRPACGKRPSRLRETSFPPAGNPFPASETRVSRKWENLKIKVLRVGYLLTPSQPHDLISNTLRYQRSWVYARRQ